MSDSVQLVEAWPAKFDTESATQYRRVCREAEHEEEAA